MKPLLSGKKILITGGTSELGSAFVLKALEHGARVFFTYFRSEEKAKGLETAGAEGFQLDLTSTEAMNGFVARFKNATGALDALVHNAAIAADGRIEDLSEGDWDRVMAANLKAPFYLTKELLPLLMTRKRGGSHLREKGTVPLAPAKVFMIVSQAGLHGLAGAANYAASKGGLIALMRSMAKEFGPWKVLVNAVNPGFMKSRLTAGLPEKATEKELDRSPLKTLSNPEEVAGFLVYLCSDMVKQVTGQIFHFESRSL